MDVATVGSKSDPNHLHDWLLDEAQATDQRQIDFLSNSITHLFTNERGSSNIIQ